MPPLFFAGEDLLRAGAFCLTYFTSFALVRPGWGFCFCFCWVLSVLLLFVVFPLLCLRTGLIRLLTGGS